MTPTPLLYQPMRRLAAKVAMEWKYPRQITWCEIVHGRWFATEDWIGYLIEGIAQDTVHMHGIGRPGASRVICAALTAPVLAAAREMGAKRVYQPIRDPATGEMRRGLVQLWRRAGWDKEDEIGVYLEVPDGR